MKNVSLVIVITVLLCSGCSRSSSEPESVEANDPTYSKDYLENVRVNVQDRTKGLINSKLLPTFELKVTNVGEKTLSKIKVYCMMTYGQLYNENLVLEKDVHIVPAQSETIKVKFPEKTITEKYQFLASKGEYTFELLGAITE